MNALRFTSPKHWLLHALLVLGLVATSCSVPNFEIGTDDAGAAAPHCSNLISDQGETGLDCGGTCPACPAGGSCMLDNDCASNECIGGVCQDASCMDGVQSGSETGVDCGGGACSPCTSGSNCLVGRDCASGVCTAGVCAQPACTDMLQNGDETDTDCGGSCATCLPGQHCRVATDCAGGGCESGVCTLTCLDGKGNCDGNAANGCEANLKTEAEHCGACDTPCDLPFSTAICNGGKCAVEKCNAPYVDCDGLPDDGCEVNTTTDPTNCGGCGLVCSAINGTASCVESKCQVTCDDGFNDCDGDPVNGCESSTSKDVTHCGSCDKICDATSGSAKCTAGVCGVSNCKTGLGDCDTNPDDCETDETTSADNCGGCGHVCVIPNATAACAASVCKVGTCIAGYADCDGNPVNGCETNIGTDVNNCGACKAACAIGNGTGKCVNKACQVSACSAPFADCDGNASNGCEANTSSSTNNCGGCAKDSAQFDCTNQFPNATAKCVASGCQLGKCALNFADCNLNPDLDGCETNLKTSNANCGACGSQCQAPFGTNTCTAGTCVPNCTTGGAGDCDGNVSTGCEAQLASDQNNCGGCAIVCQQVNATNTCTSGACTPACSQSYFKSCDGNANNGCETDTRSNPTNCGACGAVCSVNAATPTNTCAGSTCIPSCATLHANCDGNPSNGCETPTAADPNNCGACGALCQTQNATGSSCSGGSCSPVCNDGFAACSNPAAGCLTSLDTIAHCGNCATACGGATPFCVSRACSKSLKIGVVDSSTIGSVSSAGGSLNLLHVLQTSAAANAYRFVIVGVTGFGNGQSGSMPASVQYNGVPMTVAKALWSGSQVSSQIYYLQAAALPAAAGTYTVRVTSSGSNGFDLTANVVELINVEQATGGLDAVGGSGTGNSCSVHTPSDSVAVSLAGEYIYSLAAVYGMASNPSPTSGQTITEQVTVGSLGTYAGYLAAPGTGSRAITWTVGACSASAHALISIKPAIAP